VRETLHIFEAIDGSEEKYLDSELDDDTRAALEAVGTVEVRQRKIKRDRVRKYIMSGGKVLEDCGYIAGKCIPVIPFYGKRWFIDNIERCSGHVRTAKDAQRLKNMQLSKLAEISALSSIEKPILTPEQVAGHQVMWSEDNIKNYPYLLINPITGPDGNMQVGGPVAYTKSASVPPALAGLLQITEQDIRDLLGNQEQGDKIVANVSGSAIEAVQQRLDMQSYIYISNMSKAIRRCGEVWLSMAKDLYIEPRRKMKGVGLQNEVEGVELMKPMMGEAGEIEYEADLSTAHFDVAVDVGPSFRSQRESIGGAAGHDRDEHGGRGHRRRARILPQEARGDWGTQAQRGRHRRGAAGGAERAARSQRRVYRGGCQEGHRRGHARRGRCDQDAGRHRTHQGQNRRNARPSATGRRSADDRRRAVDWPTGQTRAIMRKRYPPGRLNG